MKIKFWKEKLYDKQVVTKKSFHNRLFEYRTDY